MFSSTKSKSIAPKKKSKKSLFKRVMAWLHLWLGLASGIIVVIVSLTGCIYVFEGEIKDFIEDWRFVQPQEKAFLLPSQLVAIADKEMKGIHAKSVTFGERNEAAIVGYFTEKKEGKAETNPDKKKQEVAKNNTIKLQEKSKEKKEKSLEKEDLEFLQAYI